MPETNTSHAVVVDTVDPFLKSIRALKSFLSSSSTSASSSSNSTEAVARSSELTALERRNKSLVFQLNDALKDAARERELRTSLELAFDQLTVHRKQVQRHLDEALAGDKQQQQQPLLQTRILSVEVEKLEAVKACEAAKQQCVAETRAKEAAERRIRELEDALAEKEWLQKANEEQHQAKLAALQAQITELGVSLGKVQQELSHTREEAAKYVLSLKDSHKVQLEDQAHHYQAKVASYEDNVSALKAEVNTLEKTLKDERQARTLAEQENADLKEKDEALHVQLGALKEEVEGLETDFQETRHELQESKHTLSLIMEQVSGSDNHGRQLDDDEEHDEEQPPRLDEEEGERPHQVEPDDEGAPPEGEQEGPHKVEPEEEHPEHQEALMEEEQGKHVEHKSKEFPQQEKEMATEPPEVKPHPEVVATASSQEEYGTQDSVPCVELLAEAAADRKRCRGTDAENVVGETKKDEQDKSLTETIVAGSSPQPSQQRAAPLPGKKRMKPSALESEDV